ncbi:MAG: peptide ABC transporter ATP-binding protein [Patescibacteria group bacterium]|nr:MAG: peptide ABC transporter ATP-binding protein [Patescibacteria group bacterium]
MIKVSSISKIYTTDNIKFYALKDISLTIEKGEYVAVLGASGSGKSTLMHIMGLLDKPSIGAVYFEKNLTTKLSDNQLSEIRNKKIGFVFQQFNLINRLTVYENVALPYFYSGRKDSKIKQRILNLLEDLQIKEKENKYPNQLSGGQQQRVAIARALIMEPDYIFADEPTGNLDSKTGKEIISILESLNKKGKTLIVVTHDKSLADRAKRKIVLQDGRLLS